MLTFNTATSGRAAFMLKKGAKIKTKRSTHKRYTTDLSILREDFNMSQRRTHQNFEMDHENASDEEEKEG